MQVFHVILRDQCWCVLALNGTPCLAVLGRQILLCAAAGCTKLAVCVVPSVGTDVLWRPCSQILLVFVLHILDTDLLHNM